MIISQIQDVITKIGFRPSDFNIRMDGSHIVAKYEPKERAQTVTLSTSTIRMLTRTLEAVPQYPFNMVCTTDGTFEVWF